MSDALLANQANVRLICFAGIFAAMALWELMAPLRAPDYPRWLRWSNNLALVAVGNLLLRLVFPLTAVAFSGWIQQRGWGLLNQLALPGWLTGACALVLLDMAIYFQHRLFHVVPVLWRLHRVHHADTGFDVTTALRFHPIEIALSMAYKFMVVAVLGASPEAVLLFEVILNGMAMFNHGNVSLPGPIERALRPLVVTPDMHRIHHSTLMCEANSNYGFNLSCWDRLFGSYTAMPSREQVTMPIGLDQFRSRRETWLDRLLILPFQRN